MPEFGGGAAQGKNLKKRSSNRSFALNSGEGNDLPYENLEDFANLNQLLDLDDSFPSAYKACINPELTTIPVK